jgi:hypothetical protein
MPEIRFDDASKLAMTILKDGFQCDPILFWDEWDCNCSSFCSMNSPWTKEELLALTDLFQCARNICSLGTHYQDVAKYSFFLKYRYILLRNASFAIERILRDASSDIKLSKKAVNMVLQSLSNMMTNNPVIINLFWADVLSCSFVLK